MKNLICLFALFMGLNISVSAQTFRSMDKSSLEVAYLPDDFAHNRRSSDKKAVVRMHYSQVPKKGREIFGGLVPYGKVWRTGANESVEIKFYQDVLLAGEKVMAGTYSFFTIPGENEWTIILNADLDYWGAYSYQEANDVLRVKVESKMMEDEVEVFSVRFEELTDGEAVMRLGWDKTLVEVPISY